MISDYSLSVFTPGMLLSSFKTGLLFSTALAFDSTDATLWFAKESTSNELYQYSTAGVLLQTGAPSGLPNGIYTAGEFAEGVTAGVPQPPSSVPEPATLLLLGTGLLGLGLMRWRKAA